MDEPQVRNRKLSTEVSDECGARLDELIALGRVAGIHFAFDRLGAFYKESQYRKALQVHFDSELDTIRFHSRDGRVPARARVLFPMFHGNGADYSHSGTMLGAVNLLQKDALRKNDIPPKRFSLSYEIAKAPHFVPVAAESIDFPFHGAGPRDDKFKKLDEMVDWVAKELRQLRKLAPRLPLIPFTRSGSTGLITSLVHKYPDLIDGMVLMSPVHPEIGYDESVEYVEKAIDAGTFPPNRPALDLVFDLMKQMRPVWGKSENPFAGIPTLILTGADDLEVVPCIRGAYARFAKNGAAAGVPTEYWDVPGVKHDVISLLTPDTTLQVFARIYKFFGETVAYQQSKGRKFDNW